MYIAPSSGHSLLTLNMTLKVILRKFEVFWCENYALFKKLMKLHSNPPILYHGFK